jgi:thiol-disulfide isomerase/thioredoxin
MSSDDTPTRRLDIRWREVVVIAVTTLAIVAGVVVVNAIRGDDSDGSATSDMAGTSKVELTGDVGVVQIGALAPGFDDTTITATAVTPTPTADDPNAIKREELVFSDLRGTPVWLVFGATWCPNCRAEIPDVQAVSEEYGDRLQVIGVYVGQELTQAVAYAQTARLTFPQIGDPHTTIGSPYGALGLPTHVFIDADGMVTDIVYGVLSVEGASKRIDAMLAAG